MKLTYTQRCVLTVLRDRELTAFGATRVVRERAGNTVSPNSATFTRLRKIGLIDMGPTCVLTLTLAGFNWLELNGVAKGKGPTRSGHGAKAE